MTHEELIRWLKAELPRLLQEDPSFRAQVIGILSEVLVSKGELARLLEELRAMREESQRRFEAADRRFEAIVEEMRAMRADFERRFEEVDRRFEAIVEEMRAMRADFERRFEEVDRRFEAADRRFEAIVEEMRAMRADFERRFEEVDRRFEQVDRRFEAADRRFEAIVEEMRAMRADFERRFEEVDRRFEQVDRRFEAADRRFEAIVEELKTLRSDFEYWVRFSQQEFTALRVKLAEVSVGLGSLGGRMGEGLEDVIRQVIEGFSGIGPLRATRLVLIDEAGEIYQPGARVEIDALVTNGRKFLVEVKNYAEADEIWAFYRKAHFAEAKLGETFEKVLIAPAATASAVALAKQLGITCHTFRVVETREPPA